MSHSRVHSNNGLLAALQPDDQALLCPYLESVALRPRQVLHHAKLPIEHVYFVEEGLVSVLTRISGGKDIQAWLIGREGLAGLPAILCAKTSMQRRVVCAEGQAKCIRTTHLCEAMDKSASLRRSLLCYAAAVLTHVSLAGACNARHTLQQRLARLLLISHDRLGRDELPLTHELLSRLLGVRRAGITMALGALEEPGIVGRGRGNVLIRDRARLEQTACGCYRAIRAEYARLLPPLRGTSKLSLGTATSVNTDTRFAVGGQAWAS